MQEETPGSTVRSPLLWYSGVGHSTEQQSLRVAKTVMGVLLVRRARAVERGCTEDKFLINIRVFEYAPRTTDSGRDQNQIGRDYTIKSWSDCNLFVG